MGSAQGPALSLAEPQPKRSGQRRLQSVDALRGAVMVLMALDHVRDFISSAAMQFSPTDLTRTTAAIFLTRWITHFCAPVFAFTAGVGAFLWMRRDRTTGQLSRFLLRRGIWLIFLELTVLRWILLGQAGWSNQLVMLSVIWMLGLSMIVLAALVHLSRGWLATLSCAVILLHNLADPIRPALFGRMAWLWDILHTQAPFPFVGANILVAYPLIPWVSVMALGYCFGPMLRWEFSRRQRFLIRAGLGLTASFIVVRAANLYGDPSRWSVQSSTLFTLLSFLNCTKYPPSLQFLLMTAGPAMLAMAALERIQWSDVNPLIVFGRVPLFYFALHLAVAHVLAIFLEWFRYGWARFLLIPPPSMGSPRQLFPPDLGFDLWVVYGVWIAVVVILYPICKWFAQLKQRRRDWWLSYL